MSCNTIGPAAGLEKQLHLLPKQVIWCRTCTESNQRPRIVFSNGQCSACTFAETQMTSVNWIQRTGELYQLLRKHGSRVIVPTSGGKDSGFVAHTLREKYGADVLGVCWAPFKRTEIGQSNYDAFIKAGFTVIEGHGNGALHRKIARLGLELTGDPWISFTYGQLAWAFHVALAFDIKLIFFGENGEARYSGDPRVFNLQGMPVGLWAEQYLKGSTVDDLVRYGEEHLAWFALSDQERLDLRWYRPPDPVKLKKAGIKFLWGSYFWRWLPEHNFYYAAEHTGFQPRGERSPGTYTKFASIDDMMDPLHFWGAYVKFGRARAVADSSHQVRERHLTREDGVALVRRYDHERPPQAHVDFACDYIGISEGQLWDTFDLWRPEHLWEKRAGEWVLKHPIND